MINHNLIGLFNNLDNLFLILDIHNNKDKLGIYLLLYKKDKRKKTSVNHHKEFNLII
jgi:hypothetical protein